MYKILLLFSSFYSLSLSLSLFTTARRQNGRRWKEKERENPGGKNSSKTYGRRKRTRRLSFVEK